ncbi:MAG: undecaprenyl-phosphate glucose phosphotransferase [Candidatus Omnitrophica bacterium]|nr:undecaprenyl-phosphate glucose phosphotransferase [Candidatus Omnitrophota bacterium]
MLKKHAQILIGCIRFTDVVLAAAAWLLSYMLRFWSGWFLPAEVPPLRYYLLVLPFIAVVWPVVFDIFQMYTPKRNASLWQELFQIVKASFMSILVLLSLSFFYRDHVYSRLVFVLFFFLSLGFIFLDRILLRKFLRFLRARGYNLKRVLIVGAGETGQKLAHKIADSNWTGFSLVGWIDDYLESGTMVCNREIIGNCAMIGEIIERYNIEQVFIALPIRAYQRLTYLLKKLEQETVDVRIAPNIYQALTLNASIEDFDGMPIINLTESPIYGWNRVLKRLFDIFVSFLALVLLLPLMGILMILIKRSSPGPVFFKQKRYGIAGKEFYVYKFRSMVVTEQDIADKLQARREDSRITPVGRFLRRTSLDELPQLYNVLLGQMSIVGPRPHPLYLDEKHKLLLETYMWRYKVKPGITGWAQVNGWRGETDTLEKMKKRIEHDIYYIEHWSVWFDLKILWLTVWKGLLSNNAY